MDKSIYKLTVLQLDSAYWEQIGLHIFHTAIWHSIDITFAYSVSCIPVCVVINIPSVFMFFIKSFELTLMVG